MFSMQAAIPAKAALLPLKNPPYLVFDVSSGEILAQNDVYLRWAPASLAKLMTAYTVFKMLDLQHLKWNSPVLVSEEAYAQPPSRLGLPIGQILTIESALKILMVKSANDISVALAQSVAGSEERFVRLMNSHARRLGMDDTQFTNPHGLHDPQQFTSARDIAVLARRITLDFPQYSNFFDIPGIRFANRYLRNHNALLRLFDGTNGMKTGYVCASGFNVVVRTKRSNRELIAVVFGQRSSFRRSVFTAKALSEAFEQKEGLSNAYLPNLQKPDDMDGIPEDITRLVCPGKYIETGRPKKRPPEAPLASKFDSIDTRIIVSDETPDQLPDNPGLPEPRPSLSSKEITINSPTKASLAEIPLRSPVKDKQSQRDKETKPVKEKSLREQAKLYLAARSDLRDRIVISTGGAIGPNPNGIKLTDGSRYEPPIPIPLPRPALDSANVE
ncbi:MAG: D-alanyl-D-alanine carboxypeptidase family protein [Pseudomonadota bacterium]